MVDKISITENDNILIYATFLKQDGSKHSATSLIQVYDKDGNLIKHFMYNIGYFHNHQVHGIAANPFKVDEFKVLTCDEENYYVNYYKWREVK